MATASVLYPPAFAQTATPDLPPIAPRPVMRRSTPVQGAALEILGHAIEYLIDSRLPEGGTTRNEEDAVRMLMACSRAVFHECEEIVPMRQRVGAWFADQLRRLPV